MKVIRDNNKYRAPEQNVLREFMARHTQLKSNLTEVLLTHFALPNSDDEFDIIKFIDEIETQMNKEESRLLDLSDEQLKIFTNWRLAIRSSNLEDRLANTMKLQDR